VPSRRDLRAQLRAINADVNEEHPQDGIGRARLQVLGCRGEAAGG